METNARKLYYMRVHVFESEAERAAAAAEGLIGADDLVLTPDTGLIDAELSDSSANPVENRAIKAYVDAAIAALKG